MNIEDITVGMACTIHTGSDRYPATVTGVFGNLNMVQVHYDEFKIVSGSIIDGSAEYEYERSTKRMTHFKYFPKVNRWYEMTYNPDSNRFRIYSKFPKITFVNRERYYNP